MLPELDLATLAHQIGPWAIVLLLAAIIFTESGILAGFFLPGDTVLFTAGVLVQTGVIDVNIFILIAVLFVAAVGGVSFGYWFGHKFGRRVFKKSDSLFFRHEYIEKAEQFYARHGGKTIILARFIPIVRTLAPIIAGVAKMDYRRFLVYNVIGAVIWIGSVVPVGYLAGGWLESSGTHIGTIIIPAIILVVILSLLSPLVRALQDKQSRAKIISALKQRLNIK